MTNSIDSSLLLSQSQAANTSNSNTLGKDDFLKLLMVQLQNQDPTSPMDDKEFISQMAQFSSLEQMTNLTTSMEEMINIQEQNQLLSYSHFVGKEITWHKLNTNEANVEVEQGTGKVASIQFKDSTVTFILEDGTELSPSNISELNQPTIDENTLVQSSLLIGKEITYQDDQGENQIAKVESVSFKDGQTYFHISGSEKLITPQQIMKIE